MSLDYELVEDIVRTTGLPFPMVRTVLLAVVDHPDYDIVRPVEHPRKKRCKQCKHLMASALLNEHGVCRVCVETRPPDDRDRPRSVVAFNGGLPTLGKKR